MKLQKRGSSVLEVVSRQVQAGDDFAEVVKLAKMARKTIGGKNGIGVSANQLGDTRRWFVWIFGDTVINPEILVYSRETISSTEGCLSEPGKQYTVTRFKRIKARWLNSRGEVQERELLGIPAMCFQHELDHLNGISLWDKR